MSRVNNPNAQRCILRILSKLLDGQVAVAKTLRQTNIIDDWARQRVLDDAERNKAQFQELIAAFQLQIEPRDTPPQP